MFYIYVKDDYCSEEIYKCIIRHSEDGIIIGFNNYDYFSRSQLFQHIFDKAIIVCEDSVEKRAKIIRRYSPCIIVLPDDEQLTGDAKKAAEEIGSNVKSIGEEVTSYNYHTNRFALRRRKSLKEIIDKKGFVRIIETSCGLTSMLLQSLEEKDKEGNVKQFDAFWMSSLCDSLHRGKPDHEITDLTDRLNSVSWTQEISPLPIMFDLDSGGAKEKFLSSLISLYNRGVSAVVIEDKIGEKVNSLSESCLLQSQDSIESFSDKIRCDRNLIKDDNFMIIPRIESLILGKGIDDALKRARKYIEANADAILIHYNKSNYKVIKQFCDGYYKLPKKSHLRLFLLNIHV